MKKEPKPSPAPKAKKAPAPAPSPMKGKKKAAENGEKEEKWKWWEEDTQRPDGVKWTFLEHKGRKWGFYKSRKNCSSGVINFISSNR